MRRATPLVLALLLGSPADPAGATPVQDRALPATRNQKRDLEPLVDLLVEGFELQTERVDPKDVKRAFAGALAVQVSWKAMQRYDPEVVRLIAMDLGIEGGEGPTAVEKNLLETYLRSPNELERALVLPEPPPLPEGLEGVALEAEQARRRELQAERTESERRLGLLPYPQVGVKNSHGKCMVHDGLTLIDLRSLREKELDKDTQRCLKELAQHYRTAFEGLFGVEGDRAFDDGFERALLHARTDTALVAVLVKLRGLARPLVYAEEHVEPDDPYRVCDVQDEVIAKVCGTLRDSALWEELRADHAAALADPKGFRRAFQERLKGER